MSLLRTEYGADGETAHNVVYNALFESLLLGAAAPLPNGLASALCMMKVGGKDTKAQSHLSILCQSPFILIQEHRLQLPR
jgi:hypothetical protein